MTGELRPVCRVDDVPLGGCVAVADGRVLVARPAEDRIVAYRNRCLHAGARLDGGLVRDGEVTCPSHLWRYRLSDGQHVNGAGRGTLEAVACEVADGVVHVAVPAETPTPLRELLLAHARTWRRDG